MEPRSEYFDDYNDLYWRDENRSKRLSGCSLDLKRAKKEYYRAERIAAANSQLTRLFYYLFDSRKRHSDKSKRLLVNADCTLEWLLPKAAVESHAALKLLEYYLEKGSWYGYPNGKGFFLQHIRNAVSIVEASQAKHSQVNRRTVQKVIDLLFEIFQRVM